MWRFDGRRRWGKDRKWMWRWEHIKCTRWDGKMYRCEDVKKENVKIRRLNVHRCSNVMWKQEHAKMICVDDMRTNVYRETCWKHRNMYVHTALLFLGVCVCMCVCVCYPPYKSQVLLYHTSDRLQWKQGWTDLLGSSFMQIFFQLLVFNFNSGSSILIFFTALNFFLRFGIKSITHLGTKNLVCFRVSNFGTPFCWIDQIQVKRNGLFFLKKLRTI